jgi:hypothetical protein
MLFVACYRRIFVWALQAEKQTFSVDENQLLIESLQTFLKLLNLIINEASNLKLISVAVRTSLEV